MQWVTFQVSGTGNEDLFGLWAPAADPAAGMASFDTPDVPSAPPPGVPVYRVSLPAGADMSAFQAALADREARLAGFSAALAQARTRLTALSAATEASTPSHGAVAFGVDGESAPDPAEAEMFALLAESRRTAQSVMTASGMVSFDTTDPLLVQARDGFEALLAQVNRVVLKFAWVETEEAGRLLARTTVGWTGDSGAFWARGITTAQASTHSRNVDLAIKSRALSMQMLFTILESAAPLAALVGAPGGAVLALPAVYQFVRRLLGQAGQLRALSGT